MNRLLYALSILMLFSCIENQGNRVAEKAGSYAAMQYATLFGVAHFKDSSRLFYPEGKDTVWCISKPNHASAMPRVVVLSSVFAGFAEALHLQESVCGVDNIRYYSDSLLIDRHKRGHITETGEEGQLNMQTLIRLKPDYVIGSSVLYNDKSLRRRLERNGITVLKCDNFKEQHPLARAEWIKFFGFLLNRQRQADSLFKTIEASYRMQKSAVHNASNGKQIARPRVLTDAMYMDAWNVPGGNSYTARLIEDAGGAYVFSHMKDLHTYPLNLETVLRAGAGADVWLHVNTYKTKQQLLQADSRYAVFKPFANGRIYNNNKRENPFGGNDFWESGVVRPDLILADLILMLSGREFSADKLYFYTPVN